MAAATRYDQQAAKGKFIAVYPNSASNLWDSGTGDTAVDLTFISRLLDQLTSDFRIDQTRIFAAGLSSGAMMAYRLACQLSDRIVAIASVAGALRNNIHDVLAGNIIEIDNEAFFYLLLLVIDGDEYICACLRG